MKRVFLFSGLATVVALVAMPAMAGDWDGAYVGGLLGMGSANWTGNLTKFVPGSPIEDDFAPGTWQNRSINGNGLLGGVELGVAKQSGGLVWGLEGDLSGSGVSGSGVFSTIDFGSGYFLNPPTNQQVFDKHIETSLDWFGTIRGRVGVLLQPGTLLYGTGGLAIGQTSSHQDVYFNGGNAIGLNYSGSDSATRVGWTLGAGIEQQMGKRWRIKAEYLFTDLGTANYRYYGTYTGYPYGGGPSPDSTDGYSPKLTASVLRVGLNYSFGN